MRNDRLTLLGFTGCAAIWGSTFLVIRIGNDSLPPIWALILRMTLAGAILALVLAVTKQPWPKGRALKYALVYGGLEFGISMPMLYFAEKTITSGLAALFYATCPIATIFVGAMFGTEKLKLSKIVVGLIALAGLLVIFGKEAGANPIGGMLLGLGAAISAVFATVLYQKGPQQSAIGGNAVGSLIGAVMCVPISLALGEKWRLPTRLEEFWPVIYLAVMGSVCAFTLAVWLLGRWKASTVAYLGVICPVIAVILGSAIGHEPIGPGVIVGGAIVILSVVLALRSEGSEKASAH